MKKEHYSKISKELNLKPNETKWMIHLLFDGSLIFSISLLLKSDFTFLVHLIVPILLFRAFALMHDCVHSSLSSKKWINDSVGILTGIFCFLPYEPWKRIHLDHHKWTGNVDKDPSMGLIKQFPSFGKNKIKFLNFCWQHWIPAMAASQHIVFWSKSYQYILLKKHANGRLKNIFSILPAILFYAFLPWKDLWPGILFYLVLVEVINFPHHLQMPMLSGNDSFPVYLQDKAARSCIYPRWISRHILNNFNLHIEHHLFPRLPWYSLDEAREKIQQYTEQDYTQVTGNHWIIENRKKSIDLVFAKNIQSLERKEAA